MDTDKIKKINDILRGKGVEQSLIDEITLELSKSSSEVNAELAKWLKNPTIDIKRSSDLSTLIEKDDLPTPSIDGDILSKESKMITGVHQSLKERVKADEELKKSKQKLEEQITADQKKWDEEWEMIVEDAESHQGQKKK